MCMYMQEAGREGDSGGDPGHGTPAAATGHQALQPRPPRLPAAAFFHLQLWQRCRQVAQVLASPILLSYSTWHTSLLLHSLELAGFYFVSYSCSILSS